MDLARIGAIAVISGAVLQTALVMRLGCTTDERNESGKEEYVEHGDGIQTGRKRSSRPTPASWLSCTPETL
jgi:hypothetical protein